MPKRLELVCPAGTPASLRAAVDAGADAIYLGFRDSTNARNFPGLNFDRDEAAAGVAYAHARGVKALIAVNTYPEAGDVGPWRRAVDDAAAIGADAVIVADMGLADYARRAHPRLRLHLSVQASVSNPEALRFCHREFGIKRAVLPRVITVPEIAALIREVPIEIEVFAFGALGIMAEGRCALSSYVTGESPNTRGVCSPAGHVRYVETGGRLASRLGEITIDSVAKDEPAWYPTLCKGRYTACGRTDYLFEDPSSLNAFDMLAELAKAGVAALKIEGRQRGRAYAVQVVTAFRRAVDALARGETPPPADLVGLTEGQATTVAAYYRAWH